MKMKKQSIYIQYIISYEKRCSSCFKKSRDGFMVTSKILYNYVLVFIILLNTLPLLM